MIVYKLKCSANHSFEGWFKDIKSYEHQRKASLVACPTCSSREVEKVMTSTRAIRSRSVTKDSSPVSEEVRYAFVKKISENIKKNFKDVGFRFFEEARKIHYGEAKPKNIYGQTTAEEEKELKEEGIEFFKFPMLKKTDD